MPMSTAPRHPGWLYLCVVGSAGGWHTVQCDTETIIYSIHGSALCAQLSRVSNLRENVRDRQHPWLFCYSRKIALF